MNTNGHENVSLSNTDIVAFNADNMSSDPITALLMIHSAKLSCESLAGKIGVLRNIVKDIEQVEQRLDKDESLATWSRVGSLFLTCGAIAGMTALNPIVGIPLVVTSAAGSVGTLISSFVLNKQNKELAETLQRFRIALQSDDLLKWACIWGLTGADLFVDVMYEASRGEIVDNRELIKVNKDSPLTAAIELVAQSQGVSAENILSRLQEIKAGTRQQMEARIETSTKTLLQSENVNNVALTVPVVETLPLVGNVLSGFNRNAIAIRDSLVTRAADSVMGGCVILAAPGGGKTTFLGTAWGHLKQRHSNKFKSLAVVVKTSDVDAFRGVSDDAVSVKHGAVSAARKIIRFIDGSTKHTGNISRLFLDDFLTMIKYFDTALKGKFIDPISGDVFHSRKEASEVCEDFVPLYDHLLTLLNEYWLVGREFNSALWVSSHSSNVEDLPFMGSATARSVGDLIFLAKNGKREFLELALNNTYLINDAQKRIILKQQLDAIALDTDEPLVLANFNNWTLGIVSSSIHDEYKSFRQQWESSKQIQDAPIRIIEETPEKFTETVLDSVEETTEDKIVFDSDNRDNDYSFITAAANIARNHILQNEWESFTLEKLRKVNKFKQLSSTKKPLTVPELKAVVSILIFSGFVIATGNDNFKVVSLLD
jgi:hypothetical protein